MTASVIAQVVMVLTLLLMITGKTPIYMTAIVGATLSALIAGFPIMGSAEMTIAKMVNTGLNPVIADMTGILLFIGIMQATGFLDVIIRDIVRVGNKLGGGTGVCSAGGIAAGVIGALTGFTQPVITAVITGPAAVRLGVDPNKCAGIQAHAGHIGNLAGFTHPTQVGLVQTMSDAVGPVLSVAPVLILFGVAFLTGFLTQSYAASVSVLVPFLQVVLQTGADPFAACFAAASGASLIQYFLTGGPVAALATVIPVIPGSDLKTANAFQRPSILAGCAMAFLITVILTLV